MRSAEKNRKRRKRCIVILSVTAAIVVVACVALAYVFIGQHNNVEALKYAGEYSQEEITQKIAENDVVTQQKLSEFSGIPLRPLTEEEQEMLSSGEITEEEAVALILGEAAPASEPAADYSETNEGQIVPNEAAAADTSDSAAVQESSASGQRVTSQTGSGTADTQSAGRASNSRVSSLLAQVYVLKAEYSSSIDSLLSQGKSELSSGASSTTELMQKYLKLGTELEKNCDSRIDGLLEELTAELQNTGQDTGIVDEIRSSYEQEKSLKKAELLSKYS